jgi:hypothetical protein
MVSGMSHFLRLGGNKVERNIGTMDNLCKKCGKPLFDDGRSTVPLELCNCHAEDDGAVGWVCPLCGRGLSPYMAVCPCKARNFPDGG